MVFQSPDEQMVATTVEREIAFGPENLGVASREIRSRVDALLKQFELEPYALRSPHLLSGGEKQRLALASVLAMQPSLLILDEVTSLLDPAGRIEVRDILRKLQGSCTLIVISQFPEESLIADRVIVLHEGDIVEDASPDELFSGPGDLSRYGLEIPLVYRLLKTAEGKNNYPETH